MLNGEEVFFEGTVSGLVRERFGTSGERGIAVALNGAVVPRSAWTETAVRGTDRVDIVTAVQGG
jgi:sulfur carrier protein